MKQLFKCLFLILFFLPYQSEGKSLSSSRLTPLPTPKAEKDNNSASITADQFSSLLDSTLNFSDNPIGDCSTGTDIKNKLDPVRDALKNIPELASLEKSSCSDLLKSVRDIIKAAKAGEPTDVAASAVVDFFGLYKNGALVKTFTVPAGRTNVGELGGILGVKPGGPIKLVPFGSSGNISK